MGARIDDTTIEEFRLNGVAVIRDKFSDWIEPLRSGIAANMETPGPFARVYQADTGTGRFLSDYCNWARIPEYRSFIFQSDAAQIAADLMGSRDVRLFHEHVLVKEAQTGVPTPWHQDQPYYSVEAARSVSMWIPLDEVPRDRTLEFVAGSHLWGKLFRPQRFNGQALNENDGLEDIPDIDGNRGDYDIRGWPLSPGDAVVFDFRTVHGAPPNTSATSQRRAFSLRLVGDDARFLRRDGIVTSPPFPDVKLKHRDPLDGPDFPILFERQAG